MNRKLFIQNGNSLRSEFEYALQMPQDDIEAMPIQNVFWNYKTVEKNYKKKRKINSKTNNRTLHTTVGVCKVCGIDDVDLMQKNFSIFQSRFLLRKNCSKSCIAICIAYWDLFGTPTKMKTTHIFRAQ